MRDASHAGRPVLSCGVDRRPGLSCTSGDARGRWPLSAVEASFYVSSSEVGDVAVAKHEVEFPCAHGAAP